MFISRIYKFYYDGFKQMTIGKTLWIIIAIKLVVIFVVLRIFFFPRAIPSGITDEQKADYVREQLLINK